MASAVGEWEASLNLRMWLRLDAATFCEIFVSCERAMDFPSFYGVQDVLCKTCIRSKREREREKGDEESTLKVS